YRRLFADIGGFNPRRQFWGEWTELNLRMWRHGFPTGYAMDGAFLRHWHKAPESPTRNMAGREQHVLWGLICTALEYDAVSVNEATETFWRLAQDRYLAYSFGEQPTPRQLLTSVLQLMPRLSSEFPAIHAFAQEAHRHRFHFKPFEPLTVEQVGTVLAYAEQAVFAYRPDLLRTTDSTPAGWWSRIRRRLAKPTMSEKQPRPTEPATVAETASETSDQEG
uniref:glycosyltransferase family 2 protein n=1 Tax=Gemmatimonas sp. TaxID=1962908 RepID=UPI0035635922